MILSLPICCVVSRYMLQKEVRMIVYHDKYYVATKCLFLMSFTRDSQRIVYIKIASVFVAFVSVLECTIFVVDR